MTGREFFLTYCKANGIKPGDIYSTKLGEACQHRARIVSEMHKQGYSFAQIGAAIKRGKSTAYYYYKKILPEGVDGSN